MRRKILTVLVLAVFIAAGSIGSAVPGPSPAARVVRDEFGRPFITAPTNQELFELLGYTTAEDRLWALELNQRGSTGTLTEVFGSGSLEADMLRRLQGYTVEEYQEVFESLMPETREILQAYVDGINRRVAEVRSNPEFLPFEFRVLNILPSYWSVTDSLAVVTASYRRFGTIGGRELSNLAALQRLLDRYDVETAWEMFNDRYWVNDPLAPTYIEEEMGEVRPVGLQMATSSIGGIFGREQAAAYLEDAPDVQEAARQYEELVENALSASQELGIPMYSESASFAWAVHGDRTATGYPMLAGNPEMGFDYPSIVYEVHLKGGNGFDVAGMSAQGWAGMSIAQNRDIAYTMMVGMGDNVDIYRETLNPENREQYFFNGQWVDMEKREETFIIAGGEPVTRTFYRTVHGPVITPYPFDPDDHITHAYTWKNSHWLLDARSVEGILAMMRAGDVYEVEEGARKVYTSMHLISADRKKGGNIAYWMAGLVPVRPGGTDFRLPLSGEGDEEWTGEFRKMPRAINPAKGYVSGWNNKSSPEFDNPDSTYFGRFHRALWLERTLEDRTDMTLDDMKNIGLMIGGVMGIASQHTGIFVEDLLPHLERAIGTVPSADPMLPRLNEAFLLLSEWDGRSVDHVVTCTVYNPAQFLYDAWLARMIFNTFQDEFQGVFSLTSFNMHFFNMLIRALDGENASLPLSRNYFNNVNTLEEETAEQIIIQSMVQAILGLSSHFQTQEMSQWIVPRYNIPINHTLLGPIGAFPYQVSGTYSIIVEFKPGGAEGISRWPYGTSAFIGMNPDGSPDLSNPHLFDMLEMYKNFEYKPMFVHPQNNRNVRGFFTPAPPAIPPGRR